MWNWCPNVSRRLSSHLTEWEMWPDLGDGLWVQRSVTGKTWRRSVPSGGLRGRAPREVAAAPSAHPGPRSPPGTAVLGPH